MSCQRPERRDHAVDRAVFAVTLGQRRLAGGVVDEGNDGRRQFGAEGDEGDELCQNLEHGYVCFSRREDLHKPRRRNPMVIENLVADPEDVAPAVRSLLPLGRGDSVRHMPRLVSDLAGRPLCPWRRRG